MNLNMQFQKVNKEVQEISLFKGSILHNTVAEQVRGSGTGLVR
jgi:hypothetical protein